MKKIILSALAICAFGIANAQEKTESTGKGFANGDIFISGSVGFTSSKTGDFKTNSFNITPMVGFMVTDNFAVGGMLGYMSDTQDVDVSGDGDFFELKTNTLAVGAFGRYYATPSNDFSFFVQGSIAYLSQKQEIDIPGSEEFKTTGFGLEVAPGVSYFIGNNWAIEASVGALSYTTVKPDVDGADSTDTFGLNVNLQDINFGIVYKF